MFMPKQTNLYKTYTLRNLLDIPQVKQYLSPEQIQNIKIVGSVLPFKVNNYVVDELIDWNHIPYDPIYQLTFLQKEMLSDKHFSEMENAINNNYSKEELKVVANKIRYELNPHPAGQEHNVPTINNQELKGIQHKYRETVLFFPQSGQTCHAFCTFCFRWPQFVGMDDLKFASKEIDLLIKYLKIHPEVTDVLFTGGDPMFMSAKKFAEYIEPLLNANLPNLRNIRIGSKSLSYWPYRFTTDKDADDLIRVFEKITKKGLHLSFMAHFNHPNELKTDAVETAIKRILSTGAVIRTQSPIMKHINDNSNDWAEMWDLQVKLGCIPYYMFVARDTGAQDYFAVSLEEAWNIYRKAYRKVSGIVRTVRGPIMSADPGKVQILGINKMDDKKLFVLRFLQGRNPNWVGKPFFAKYNPDAIWLSDLTPLGESDKFFYEEEIEELKILSN